MDIKALKSILMMTEAQLQDYLYDELNKLGYKVECGKDSKNKTLYLYAIKEESHPVLLIAHTDTVHDHPPNEIYFDDIDGVYIAQNGLGADDRAGVYASMELIKNNNCDVLFTSLEEKGSFGAKQFIQDYDKNPKYHMLVQLDNPGENGAMFYDNESQEFQDYILGFGFVPATGKSSDIKIIAPHWRVNAVNLSVGYYQAHKKYEQLNPDHLESTIIKVNKMLKETIPSFDYDD